MELKNLLETIAPYTLINFSVLKRLFPNESLRDIRETLRIAQDKGQLITHEFPNLRCFSLSRLGFETIGINHCPSLHLKAKQADTICRVNHIRIGFQESLEAIEGLKLHRWISGGKFQKNPIYIRINNKEQKLRPLASAILKDKANTYKIFCIHPFTDLEFLNRDIFLYQLAEQRDLLAKRWYLPAETPVRIIVLVDSYKAVYGIQQNLKSTFFKQVLFLPETKVHCLQLLQQQIFLNSQGKKISIV